MNRLLLLFLSTVACLGAADVQFDFRNSALESQKVKSLQWVPIYVYDVTNNVLVTRDRLMRTTATDGTLTISNVLQGLYRSEFAGATTTTTNWFQIPNTNGTINAWLYKTNSAFGGFPSNAMFATYATLLSTSNALQVQIQTSALPPGVLTNNQTNATLAGTFSGTFGTPSQASLVVKDQYTLVFPDTAAPVMTMRKAGATRWVQFDLAPLVSTAGFVGNLDGIADEAWYAREAGIADYVTAGVTNYFTGYADAAASLVATNATNYANAVGSRGTNLTLEVGQNLTNYVNTIAASNTAGVVSWEGQTGVVVMDKTNIVQRLGYTPQPGSANLTNWSGQAPTSASITGAFTGTLAGNATSATSAGFASIAGTANAITNTITTTLTASWRGDDNTLSNNLKTISYAADNTTSNALYAITASSNNRYSQTLPDWMMLNRAKGNDVLAERIRTNVTVVTNYAPLGIGTFDVAFVTAVSNAAPGTMFQLSDGVYNIGDAGILMNTNVTIVGGSMSNTVLFTSKCEGRIRMQNGTTLANCTITNSQADVSYSGGIGNSEGTANGALVVNVVVQAREDSVRFDAIPCDVWFYNCVICSHWDGIVSGGHTQSVMSVYNTWVLNDDTDTANQVDGCRAVRWRGGGPFYAEKSRFETKLIQWPNAVDAFVFGTDPTPGPDPGVLAAQCTLIDTDLTLLGMNLTVPGGDFYALHIVNGGLCPILLAGCSTNGVKLTTYPLYNTPSASNPIRVFPFTWGDTNAFSIAAGTNVVVTTNGAVFTVSATAAGGGITNGQTGVSLVGTFGGNGAGLSNLTAVIGSATATNLASGLSATNLNLVGYTTNGNKVSWNDGTNSYWQWLSNGDIWKATPTGGLYSNDVEVVGGGTSQTEWPYTAITNSQWLTASSNVNSSQITWNSDISIPENKLTANEVSVGANSIGGDGFYGNGAGVTNVQGSNVVGTVSAATNLTGNILISQVTSPGSILTNGFTGPATFSNAVTVVGTNYVTKLRVGGAAETADAINVTGSIRTSGGATIGGNSSMQRVLVSSGTAADAGLRVGENGTGLYLPSAGLLGITAGGVSAGTFTATMGTFPGTLTCSNLFAGLPQLPQIPTNNIPASSSGVTNFILLNLTNTLGGGGPCFVATNIAASGSFIIRKITTTDSTWP